MIKAKALMKKALKISENHKSKRYIIVFLLVLIFNIAYTFYFGCNMTPVTKTEQALDILTAIVLNGNALMYGLSGEKVEKFIATLILTYAISSYYLDHMFRICSGN